MKSLYKLVLKTNIKGPSLAFPLIMPFVFILLYSVMITPGLNQGNVNKIVSSFYIAIVSVITMQSGLMGFGINFTTIKKSVLLRRIGATELSKMDVILAMILFGLTLWVISFIWILLLTVVFTEIGIFYSAPQFENGKNVVASLEWLQLINWGRLIATTLVMLFLSYTMGMFFTTIAPDDQAYMGIAMMYFFFAAFFGGLLMPGDTPAWMEYIGYIVPHGYIDPLYDWVIGKKIEVVSGILGIVIPLIVGTLALFGAAKLLKFD